MEVLNNNYFVNMLPCPYKLKKGEEVNIYPILVKEYVLYDWAKEILLIEKNKLNDINAIQMSYLEFIIKYLLQEEEYQSKLYWLFKLCLHKDKISFGNNYLILLNEQDEIESVISSKEFDDISKIILSYNDISYDDRYISDEIKELANEYYRIKYKDIVVPTLEKRKAFVSSKISKTFSEINELPYREFELIYNACKDSEIYFGEKIIQASYKYDVKENIIHPLFEKPKDPYDEVLSDTSVLSNKGISGVEQLSNM